MECVSVTAGVVSCRVVSCRVMLGSRYQDVRVFSGCVPGTGVCGCSCRESSCKGESVSSSGSAVRICTKQTNQRSLSILSFTCYRLAPRQTSLPAGRRRGSSASRGCCRLRWPWPETAGWTSGTEVSLTCTLWRGTDEWICSPQNTLKGQFTPKWQNKKLEGSTTRQVRGNIEVVSVDVLWQGSCVMVVMKGLAPMWLSCWANGCCDEACSCCWKEIGCSVVNPPPTLLMTGTVWGCVEVKPGKQVTLFCDFSVYSHITQEGNGEPALPMRSEDSPRLMTPGSEAMMRLCEEAGEADRLCREVRVLTGGSGPPLDTWEQTTAWAGRRAGSLRYTLGRDHDTTAHLFGVLSLEECVTGLQLDRTDHKTTHSLSSTSSDWAHCVTQDLMAVFHTWKQQQAVKVNSEWEVVIRRHLPVCTQRNKTHWYYVINSKTEEVHVEHLLN